MHQLIDGKETASKIIARVKEETQRLYACASLQPGLVVIIIGNDPASRIYVGAKSKKAEECGFYSIQYTLEENVEETELLNLIQDLNHNDKIHGILIQLPVPKHINQEKVLQAVSCHKDVDGFHCMNIGKLTSGYCSDSFVPCTPAGAMILIRQVRGENLAGLNALVIGRSNIVGKPMASLLLQANCTVTIAHRYTKDLLYFSQNADILVVAVGKAKMVKQDWVKPGATVIDVGINRILDEEGRSILVGDVDYSGVLAQAGAITPVPGGVGPMTIAMLMVNTLCGAYRFAGLPFPDVCR